MQIGKDRLQHCWIIRNCLTLHSSGSDLTFLRPWSWLDWNSLQHCAVIVTTSMAVGNEPPGLKSSLLIVIQVQQCYLIKIAEFITLNCGLGCHTLCICQEVTALLQSGCNFSWWDCFFELASILRLSQTHIYEGVTCLPSYCTKGWVLGSRSNATRAITISVYFFVIYWPEKGLWDRLLEQAPIRQRPSRSLWLAETPFWVNEQAVTARS
jgi:hypothetical protein